MIVRESLTFSINRQTKSVSIKLLYKANLTEQSRTLSINNMFRPISITFIALIASINLFAQSEILTNSEIIEMTKVGLSSEIVIRKIRTSSTRFDVSALGLIQLKKAAVPDGVITSMIDRQEILPPDAANGGTPAFSESGSTPNPFVTSSNVPISKKEVLASAKTVAIEKSSVQPSRQALEKELMKRPEFKKLGLSITRYKDSADIYVEIGFVHGSLITHRYAYRIYDRRGGTVLAAGETTSWGSLAENLARNISKSLAAL